MHSRNNPEAAGPSSSLPFHASPPLRDENPTTVILHLVAASMEKQPVILSFVRRQQDEAKDLRL